MEARPWPPERGAAAHADQELPLLSETRQTWSTVTPGLERRMSSACRRLRPDSGTPETRSKISPICKIFLWDSSKIFLCDYTLSFPVSQAGWSGNIFLTLTKFVHGAGASGPPSMENPRPSEFRLISTSKVLSKSENSGTRRVFGF